MSTTGAPVRSKTFVKIQEKNINNARSRLWAVIKGQGSENSPMTNSVQKPSKLTSKLKTTLKLSKFGAPSKVHSKAPSEASPKGSHKTASSYGSTKHKKAVYDNVNTKNKAISSKQVKNIQAKMMCTQKGKQGSLCTKNEPDLLSTDKDNEEKLSKILALVKEAKELDMIDNFDIIYNEDGVPVIRADNITKKDLDRFVTKVSPLPLPEMSADNILSEIDKETVCN